MWNCLVYVAGPITAPTPHKTTRNINLGMETADRLWRKWHIPAFSPHAQSAYVVREKLWDQEKDYLPTLAGDLEVINRSDALLLLPGWENSLGTQLEVGFANYLGLKVFESELALVEWVKESHDYENLYDMAGDLVQFQKVIDALELEVVDAETA